MLGHNKAVDQLSTGGFPIDVAFSPTAVRELAKMDGAIILDADAERILRAGVHLMPDPSLPTDETGTRHRTADRVAQQTKAAVITVSASMNTIQLFLGERHTLIETPAAILTRANLALQTLHRYKGRLVQVLARLSALEVQDQVTIRDIAAVAQRMDLVRRLSTEIRGYITDLGTDGRLVEMQLLEIGVGMEDLPDLLALDYTTDDATVDLLSLSTLSDADIVDPAVVARRLGFTESLETRIQVRGYRQLAEINRLPSSVATRLIDHFGNLQNLFGASTSELQEVEGVGEGRARLIRDGLTRLAESAYNERLH